MKKLLVTIAALGFSTAALAQVATDFASVDADASGDISFAEAQVVWPDLTEEAFAAADVSMTGTLNLEEFEALLAANPVMQ
jgi:hypothetical protein